MGAPAVRIARSELLVPPELRVHDRVPHPAARVGGARIELVRSNGHTCLGTCYQQVPVRLMPPFQFETEPAALLYLINLTAGLLDGDGHRIEVTARAGTRAVVTGQSATRIHPAVSNYATQQWDVTVEDDACLVVLPGPLIPFSGSRYFQHARVQLAPGARLIWGDIWLPGRYERGVLSEIFQFEQIIQDFEARREGRLVYRDRFRWQGPWSRQDAQWYFGAHMCSASLFVAGPVPETLLPAIPTVERSLFRLGTGETCLRWCGPPEDVTADLVDVAMRLAASWAPSDDARPWLIQSRSLASNHWFMPLDNQSRTARD